MHNTLVVYYSRTGYVAAVAKELAIGHGYALEEIVETEDHKGGFGYFKAVIDALLKRPGEILTMHNKIVDFQKIMICTPVWAGTLPPAVRTFCIAHAEDIQQTEYVIMHGSANKAYTEVFQELDSLLGKKSVKQTSLVTPAAVPKVKEKE